jgi:hypothetical protein
MWSGHAISKTCSAPETSGAKRRVRRFVCYAPYPVLVRRGGLLIRFRAFVSMRSRIRVKMAATMIPLTTLPAPVAHLTQS